MPDLVVVEPDPDLFEVGPSVAPSADVMDKVRCRPRLVLKEGGKEEA
jgi:hypothetical protein